LQQSEDVISITEDVISITEDVISITEDVISITEDVISIIEMRARFHDIPALGLDLRNHCRSRLVIRLTR